MDCRAFNTSSVASGFVSLEHFRPMHLVTPFSLADANDRRSALRDAALSRRAPPVAPSPTVVGGPRVRILLPPERWYGAGGEEMAPSSLQPTDGVP